MAAAERDSLLAWVLASLPPGSLATPEGAAADIDVAGEGRSKTRAGHMLLGAF